MSIRRSSLSIVLLMILLAQATFAETTVEPEEPSPVFRSTSAGDCTYFNNNVRVPEEIDLEPADVRDWLDEHQENIAIEGLGFERCLIHMAALDNAVHVLEWFETRGADFTISDAIERTPMYSAALGNSIEAMAWLEARGIDISIRGLGGSVPMHGAAMRNAVNAMEWLYSRGADVNVQGNGNNTPMHGAAIANAINAVKWLAKHGADLNMQDKWCNTPLDFAMKRKATETIAWLQENGGQTHNWTGEQDLEGDFDMRMILDDQPCDVD